MSLKRKLHFTFFKNKWLNKYSVSFLLFIVWIGFFDRYNLIDQFALSSNVTKLEKEKLDYQKKLVEAKKEKIILEKDEERYAREKYFMHKDNEDVFIIEREEK